jgi:hypothetical protein
MRSRCLLVYDEAAETAEVLAAVYEPTGIAVRRVRPSHQPTLQSDPTERSVLVVDQRESGRTDGRRIVIGRLPENPPQDSPLPGSRRLPALFRYSELVAAIDQILTDKAA